MCPFGLSRPFSTQIHSSTLNHVGSPIQSATHPMPRELPYVPWSPLVRHRGKRTWSSCPGRISQDYSIQQTPFFLYLGPELITSLLEEERVRSVPPGSKSGSTDAKMHLQELCQPMQSYCVSTTPSSLACHIGQTPSPPQCLVALVVHLDHRNLNLYLARGSASFLPRTFLFSLVTLAASEGPT